MRLYTIPYGTLSSRQMRQLAFIADKWDKGYGHFTTRQNIQFNWPRLIDTPDILDALADVDMHAIQTSGNTIRNVTTDQFAGAAIDEVADPRHAELIRQWSTDHPEFQFLHENSRSLSQGRRKGQSSEHTISDCNSLSTKTHTFKVFVGGGLGRTPVIGRELVNRLPAEIFFLISKLFCRCITSLVVVTKYKARIKITVGAMGIDVFRAKD